MIEGISTASSVATYGHRAEQMWSLFMLEMVGNPVRSLSVINHVADMMRLILAVYAIWSCHSSMEAYDGRNIIEGVSTDTRNANWSPKK